MKPTSHERPSVCAKQNCRRPVQVALTFDYEERIAWLDDIGSGNDPRSTYLCLGCGERFTVPIGWQLVDRSDPEPLDRVLPPTHPAVAVRGTYEASSESLDIELDIPDEEHPSGPLDLRNRREPRSVTDELERLARHLDDVPSLDDAELTPPRQHHRIQVRRAVVPRERIDDWDEDTFGDQIDAELTEELSIIGLADRSWPNDVDTQIRPAGWADPR